MTKSSSLRGPATLRVPFLTARMPVGLGWEPLRVVQIPDQGALYRFIHVATMAKALSSLDSMRLPRSGGIGPTWLVSVSDGVSGGRPTSAQVAVVRCAFDMLTAEEDNHHPGVARHFFLPVDPSERVDCECKADEVQVVEADGYVWSNDPSDCRGCDLERSLRAVGKTRPCPIHARALADDATASLPENGDTQA